MLSYKRRRLARKYRVCVFHKTGMDDTAHVVFPRQLGELDDVALQMTAWRRLRH